MPCPLQHEGIGENADDRGGEKPPRDEREAMLATLRAAAAPPRARFWGLGSSARGSRARLVPVDVGGC
jgi:hypothetical protein